MGGGFSPLPGMTIGGGKGGGGSAPSTPDFNAAATATQTNPFGATSQWSQGPGGKWTQNQSFGGPLGGAVQGLENQFANGWSSPLDNGAQARQGAQNAIYGQETSRLEPQWQQQQQQFESGLTNQGIDPNSKAGQDAYGNFNRAKNDAYQQANYGSIIGGGQEAQRQQQMDLQSRMGPLGALSGLGGLSGQSQNPLLAAAMAQYQGGLQKYGIDQQGKNSTMGGLAGLGGSLGAASILASDERLKEDVVRHSFEMLPGVPLASFRYKWEPPGTIHTGVIAQDLERVRPDLVTYIDGYRFVPAYLMLK